MPKPPPLPALFAARLVQARKLRKLSQRALGDKVGLGKATGSTRINRYERGVSSPGLAGLEALAQTLDLPAAYLLADSAAMAEVIEAFERIPKAKHSALARAMNMMANDADLLDLLVEATELDQESWDALVERLKNR